MLNHSRPRYTGDGHTWNTMSNILLESLMWGSYFLEGGSRKRGSDEPPNPPPWLRACIAAGKTSIIVMFCHGSALLSGSEMKSFIILGKNDNV